jgi:hypothetical protein
MVRTAQAKREILDALAEEERQQAQARDQAQAAFNATPIGRLLRRR